MTQVSRVIIKVLEKLQGRLEKQRDDTNYEKLFKKLQKNIRMTSLEELRKEFDG